MRTRWWDDAACKGQPLEVFYPDGRNPFQYREALRICSGCPVREACLADAIETEPRWRYGVRGGMTPEQRRVTVRQMLSDGTLVRRPMPIQHGNAGSYQRCRLEPNGPCDGCREAHRINQQFARPTRAAS